MVRQRLKSKGLIAAALGLAVLAGCEEKDPVLTGERLGVREVLETRGLPGEDVTRTDRAGEVSNARAISLPQPVANAGWTQSPVSPAVRVDHAALADSLQPLFSAPIGAGDSRRQRLNADPVVGDGRIYTMDAENRVRATSTSGALLWEADLTPLRERAPEGQGGGLALGGGQLYVASGFGTLTALDPATGAEQWVQKLGSTATGAPSYADGLVYVVSGDSTGWAVEADNGRVRWQMDGTGDSNNVAGTPAPAVGAQHVVFSYGSGAVSGAFRQGGLPLWTSEILGRRGGVTVAGIDDITGDPLIAGDTVYAGNHSGRVAAMSVFSGARKWTADYGALGPMWPAGDSVFFVSDRHQLVRLDAETGETVWTADLPGYEPTRRPNKRRDRAFANHGPILAGGRLMVASSDGKMRAFSPEDGSLVQEIDVPGGATTRPVVAGQTLYVVSRKGVLHAYR